MLAPDLKQCQFCGKEFGRGKDRSRADFAEAKFCSRACYLGGRAGTTWGPLQERLATLVDQGLSAAQIGGELGVSRGAVVSRCIRTGLKLKGKLGYSGPRAPRLKSPKPPKPKKLRSNWPRNVAEDCLIPIEQRRSLLELDAFSCRWPVGHVGDLFFCGAIPEEGRPYCGAHFRRAYRVE